jgi:carbonic anhydrase
MALSIGNRLITIIALFTSCAAFVPKHFSRAKLQSSTQVALTEQEAWFKRSGAWDDKDLDTLLEANRKWVAKKTAENPKLFEQDMQMPHNPKIMWVGCSDARVPANELINEPPGNVFVTRNIANSVISTDCNTMSVLQYAVDYLKVKHIVVCGHYECGGVKASLSVFDHKAPLENWIKGIRDVARMHDNELSKKSDFDSKFRRMVELNAQEQAKNLLKTSTVQNRRLATARQMAAGDPDIEFVEPQVHAFVYDPLNGILKKLDVDYSQLGGELKAYSVLDPAVAIEAGIMR